jgi:hypothetical protein
VRLELGAEMRSEKEEDNKLLPSEANKATEDVFVETASSEHEEVF